MTFDLSQQGKLLDMDSEEGQIPLGKEISKSTSSPAESLDVKGNPRRHPNIKHPSSKHSPIETPSSSNDEVSRVRRSSTEEYGHIPFDEFSLQIKALCEQLWPSPSHLSRTDRLLGGPKDRIRLILLGKRFNRSLQLTSSSRDFVVERVKGGGFNRIFGIRILHPNGDSPTDLILRVPRFGDANHDSEVTVLHFVRQYTPIPVPEIKFVDATNNNPLKESYVIQSRILGSDLQADDKPTWYPNLSHAQKRTVAKELAEILRELHFVTHPYPGEIEAHSNDDKSRAYNVQPFKLKTALAVPGLEQDLNTIWPFLQTRPFDPKYESADSIPFEQTTYYFMLAQFGRWKAFELRCDPASIGWSKQYDDLVIAAGQMDKVFDLGDSENCLCHLDLNTAPRNIMAHINADGALKISGILDWDSAIFAPRFVGCAPPMWLWAWSDEEENEKCANNEPSTPEQRELKQIFEETMGDWFSKYAYEPEYRMARKLFEYAVNGIRSSTDKEEADHFLDEWAQFYAEKKDRMTEDANEPEGISNRIPEEIDDLTSPNEANHP